MKNIATLDMQAMLAGNFLNAGLLYILLGANDMLGVHMVIISWIAAYVGAFVCVLGEAYEDVLPTNVYYGAMVVHVGAMVLCLGTSLGAIVRVFTV